MAKDQPTSVRLDPDTLRRLEALVPLLQRTAYGDLGEISRSKALRLAVLRGLDALETEVKSKARAK